MVAAGGIASQPRRVRRNFAQGWRAIAIARTLRSCRIERGFGKIAAELRRDVTFDELSGEQGIFAGETLRRRVLNFLLRASVSL
jgi:hypothetical protein